ncbi:ATP-dependent DNA helicase PIF1 [Trifolium repens]|nr:ATP-dependent DNA helicase PIF1 [Trifolium repens]
MDRPRHVWNESKHLLADGILYEQRRIAKNRALELSEEELDNLTLLEIEKFLQANRRSLADFPTMPYPKGYVTETLGNRLIYDEKNYNSAEQLLEFNKLYASLTDEQKAIYEKIIDAVNRQQGGVFFLHGYGGTGKTFMWKTLASSLRAHKKICLTVASSGIASLLLPGGRTAHSKFKIPVPTLENSTCNIDHSDELAGLLKQTKLIIWDEAPMAHRPDYLQSRAILASTIQIVDEINNYVLDLIPGEAVEYSSADSIDRSEAAHSQAFDVVTTEFLSSLRCSGNMNAKNCMAEHKVL